MPRMLLLAAMLAWSAPTDLSAQALEDRTPTFTNLTVAGGLGIATPDVGLHLTLSAMLPPGEFVLRYAGGSEFRLFQPAEGAGDVALLYGVRSTSSAGWARAAVGLGFVTLDRRRDIQDPGCPSLQDVPAFTWPILFGPYLACPRYEKVSSNTLGLAGQVDLVWAPVSWYGLGVTVFGNMNGGRSFAGLTVTTYLGDLR